MIFETVLIITVIIAVIVTTVLSIDPGPSEAIPGFLILTVSVLLLVSQYFSSQMYVAEVLAVNKDRAGDISWSFGESISVDRDRAEGILAPFEVAVRKVEDGRVAVLENGNRILWWKFNSKALQFEMEAGMTYRFRVAGWFDPNIVAAEPVEATVVCGCPETTPEDDQSLGNVD